jgi:hypothetical protein
LGRRRITERYPAPDGALTLLVVREEDDIAVGFDGLPWHTPADIIAQRPASAITFADATRNGESDAGPDVVPLP